MPSRNLSFIRNAALIAAIVGCVTVSAGAQTISAVRFDNATDSLGKFPGYTNLQVSTKAPVTGSALADAAMQQNMQVKISKAKDRRELMKHLREMTFAEDAQENHANRKFFFNLGNAFAKLHLYSLAMKCFFKTQQYNQNEADNSEPAMLTIVDSVKTPANTFVADTTLLDEQYLGFNMKDDSLMDTKPDALLSADAKQPVSPKITYERIAQPFADGKKAVAYAMLMHVKQPIPGKHKVYHFTNSGHTFITLIKYNSDSTYVSVSFGFYPDKDHPLAGTPLFPSSSSTFKDDSNHGWDEVAGRFISKRRFEKILALTKNYNGIKYHLNKNNCTDFGLNAASVADIHVKETVGGWPLGHGNNPGITGQSILLGNVFDGNTNSNSTLFINHDLLIKASGN